ncbi:uncharacterized protein LOC129570704 isoform X2 [Sitodiplosis mosellana]|uniref:uncharacterized protein LOC129570704 isoform X2 n=1 Tax=Sitodiplosis mosellana TaxID=263140 RepID=UPI002444EB3D|nr:uncharacterized protein LOC129570704 isoform X2 [Sitodiplosis mosellana]
MSQEFFNSTEGDWFLSNLSDNDAMNWNNPSVAGVFQNPPKNQIDSLFTRVQHRHFVCGACGEKIPEENLTNHHSVKHSRVPFIMDMYELFEIDEQFQCLCCNYEILESNFQTHLELFHPEVMANCANENVPLTSEYVNPEPNQQSTFDYPIHGANQQTIYSDATSRFYRCKACPSSGISQSNLNRHRSRVHPNIPAGTDLFQLIKVLTKIKCDVCKKEIKSDRIEKHRLKYHPDKFGEARSETPTTEPSEGFHNICVSTSELERLTRLDRIYELNGRIHLKDFN